MAGCVAGPANRLMNHFRPAPIAFSRLSGRKPVTATASKATAPAGIDHLSVTAIVVPTSVTAQILMPIASASLSPASRSCDRRAQPKPGSNRQAAATKPKRSVPIRPVAARRMTPIATARASANASFFVNRYTFAESSERSCQTAILSVLQSQRTAKPTLWSS
jgi:hypothetical protein